MGESCGGIEVVLGRSWPVLGGLGTSCGDLRQSRGHVEAVLKRSWGGLRVVLERLGLQDTPKTPKGDPKDAPKTRHVAPGGPQEARRCHQDAREPGGEAQKYGKTYTFSTFNEISSKESEKPACRPLGTVLHMLCRSCAILKPSRGGLEAILGRSRGGFGPSWVPRRPQDAARRH